MIVVTQQNYSPPHIVPGRIELGSIDGANEMGEYGNRQPLPSDREVILCAILGNLLRPLTRLPAPSVRVPQALPAD